jgi:kumamolisin
MQTNRLAKTLFAAVSAVAIIALAPLKTAGALETKNVSPWVAKAERVGTASEDATVRIVFYLGLKNQDSLRDLVKAMYTRGNPRYQKYLSPEAFRSQFGQDAKDVALVRETVRSMGFKIESVAKSGFFVEASGTVAQVKAALGVSQDLYSYKGMVLRANKEAPRLPARIANLVTHVDGLDEGGALRHPFHVSADEATKDLT